MAIINDKIWIADTPRARILELGLNGRINRVMALEPGTEPVDLVQVNNRIAVSDRANHRIIILDMDGNKVSTWGSRGGDMGEFIYPGLMAEGPENRLIVADILNRRVVTFSPSGRFPQLVAKPGLKKGQIARPKGIALDGDNNIWVGDGYTGTLQLFSSSGNFLGLATIGGETLRANAPMGLWVDAVNRLWVVESASNKISVYRITNE
jgi:sugar lactone lactonase YvrE